MELEHVPYPVRLMDIHHQIALPTGHVLCLQDGFAFLHIEKIRQELFSLTTYEERKLVLFFHLLHIQGKNKSQLPRSKLGKAM